mgnify:CR=1 FL=1
MAPKKKVIIAYDADLTILKEYHMNIALRKYGIDPKEFWEQVKAVELTQRGKFDRRTDISWLANILHEVKHGKMKGLTRKHLKEFGKEVHSILYPGLPEFFSEIKKASPDLDIQQHIISMGIEKLLRGAKLEVDGVHAYDFYWELDKSSGEEIDFISNTVSEWDKFGILKSLCDKFDCPLKNVIYFGDGDSDKPTFWVLGLVGGKRIGVFDKEKANWQEKVEDIKNSVDIILPADYSKDGEIWNKTMEFLGEIRNNINQKL